MDGNRPRIADKAVLANRTDDQGRLPCLIDIINCWPNTFAEVVVARPSLRTPNAIPGLFGYLSQEKGKPRAPQKR
jgi:hypothetical protein